MPFAVLSELAADRPVSGSALARRLGVTRAAVWKQIERLRALGVPVVAAAGRGYRLHSPVELLDRQRILDELSLASSGSASAAGVADVAVHWQIDSTNSELSRRAAGDPRDRLACLAEIQSAGRGRHGRHWCMPLAGGLAVSLLKRFDLSMSGLAGLSLVAGIALVRALADCGFGEVGLKWPNDAVAGGRKLAGILVELGGDALGPCHAVIGIGVNIRLDARSAAAIDQPWTDLATLGNGATPPRNRLAARVLQRLVEALDLFATGGFAAFAAEYARYDVLAGRDVRVGLSGTVREGRALGIDARGALVVRGDGRDFSVDAGEVSVREAG